MSSEAVEQGCYLGEYQVLCKPLTAFREPCMETQKRTEVAKSNRVGEKELGAIFASQVFLLSLNCLLWRLGTLLFTHNLKFIN